jgi:hypothetical protein
MPEQLSKLWSRLQANLPQLTQGEFWIFVFLAAVVIAVGLFIYFKG